MNNFINILNYLGISVSIESNPVLLFLYVILLFAILGLFSFFNIVIYLGVLYLSNNRLLLDKISKWPLLVKLLNIYKKTRIAFIIFEVFFFLFCQCSIIWFCFRFITEIF